GRATGQYVGGPDRLGGSMRSGPPAPGRYSLRLSGEGIANTCREFVVVDGQTTSVEIALERGVRHSLEIRDATGGAWHSLDLAVTDANGLQVWGMALNRRGDEVPHFVCDLGVGSWRVQAKTDTRRTAATTVYVADAATTPPPVIVELR